MKKEKNDVPYEENKEEVLNIEVSINEPYPLGFLTELITEFEEE